VQYDLTLRYAIAPRCFYVSGVRWSFHTTKTHCCPEPTRRHVRKLAKADLHRFTQRAWTLGDYIPSMCGRAIQSSGPLRYALGARICSRPRTLAAGLPMRGPRPSDQLAAELADIYPAFAHKLADLLMRTDANDRQVEYINRHRAPASEEPFQKPLAK
jgi:hypothetical protein